VITTSPYTTARLADFGVSSSRIGTAEPGVDDLFIKAPARRPDSPAVDGEPLLLCVAQLSPRKAQHQLVEALAGLAGLPWRCVLVGSTERDAGYASHIGDIISAQGLGDRVELTGELDEPALAAYYDRADGFVFPSLYEGVWHGGG